MNLDTIQEKKFIRESRLKSETEKKEGTKLY